MDKIVYKGSELSDALKNGTMSNSIAGLVRQSSTAGYVSFSLTNGSDWTEIPANMIVSAEPVQIALPHLRDPVMRITLAAPKSEEAKVLLSLLRASMANLASQIGAIQDVPSSPTTIARDDAPPDTRSPTGAWCCVRGKAYPCGSTIDGGLLICCSEWEPCTTMGPRAGVVMA